MTSRYTGSGETQLQQDLDRFSRLSDGDANGFIELVERVLSTTLTEDFWRVTVPEALVTSGPAMSPVYQCYLAALNTLDAEMFMLKAPRVREWMDPSLPQKKGMEGHHLFPRKYQENVLGITDLKRINQAANFAPTDWDTNIEINDQAPKDYWPTLVARRYGSEENMGQQRRWHALPDGWHLMEYDEFLGQRRKLMAQVIRDGYSAIGSALMPMVATAPAPAQDMSELATLQWMMDQDLIHAGDQLGTSDPDWTVDATVSEDGDIIINGIHTFDSLDDAAASLGITNMDGLDFWALKTETGVIALRDLIENHGTDHTEP